jgi:hypothetical protein
MELGKVYTVSASNVSSIRQLKRITWLPQDDVTVLELAKAMPLLINMAQNPWAYWEDYIPSDLRRHFKIEDQ